MKGMFIMKISTKGRYALRMLVDLAINGADKYVALKDIAERQQISKKYLEQIVLLFNGADVLEANRGFQGGYRLNKELDDHTNVQVVSIYSPVEPDKIIKVVGNDQSLEVKTLTISDILTNE